jgi:hypothetical protein
VEQTTEENTGGANHRGKHWWSKPQRRTLVEQTTEENTGGANHRGQHWWRKPQRTTLVEQTTEENTMGKICFDHTQRRRISTSVKHFQRLSRQLERWASRS